MSARGGPAGWGTVLALAVIAATFSAVSPALLLVVPFVLLVLALPPRRLLLTLAAFALGVAVMTGPQGGVMWYFERGWALLLGAWFVLVVMALPGGGFIGRGLLALAGAVTTSLPFLWLNRGAFHRLDGALGANLREAAAQAAAAWSKLATKTPTSGEKPAAETLVQGIQKAAELQQLLFPALLALASLAALAVAWWGWRRLAAQDPEPLRPLREFRFPNDLVWVLIAGIALLLLPTGEGTSRAGANLLTFMAALYALRGAAVLLVIGGAPGPFGVVLGLLAVLFLYPLVMATTVIVGLTDTWLDIRARRGASPPRV